MKNFHVQYSIFNMQYAGIAVVCAALVLNGLAVQAAPPAARTAFDSGLQAFAASNFAAAAESFSAAAAAAPPRSSIPPPPIYNAGLAAYAAGDPQAAAESFARAAAGADLALQAMAYYNRGHALLTQSAGVAQALPALPAAGVGNTVLDSAESAMGEAIQMFENAIALDPQDVDAKANYELAVMLQQQIQQQQQQQQDQQQDSPEQDPNDSPEQPSSDPPQPQEEDPEQQQPQQPQAAESQPEESQEEQPQPAQEEKPSGEMTEEEAKCCWTPSRSRSNPSATASILSSAVPSLLKKTGRCNPPR
jgi:Ca-activated chloride channel homolog